MKKKMFAAASATIVGLATLGLAMPTAAFADDAVTSNQSGTSNQNLEVKAGSLELTDVTPTVDFDSTDVASVHDSGYNNTQSVAATVQDYRGGNGVWTLSVASGGAFARDLGATVSVTKAAGTADEKATGAALGLPTEEKTQLGTDATNVASATGATGSNALNYDVTVDIPQGTNVKAKTSYTDTLNWSLNSGVVNDGTVAGTQE